MLYTFVQLPYQSYIDKVFSPLQKKKKKKTYIANTI